MPTPRPWRSRHSGGVWSAREDVDGLRAFRARPAVHRRRSSASCASASCRTSRRTSISSSRTRRLAAVAHPADHRAAEGRGEGGRAVEPVPARQRATAPASTTATTRRSPRSWGAASSRPRSSTAARPTPATPRCWCATARDEQKERWLAPLLAGEIRSGFAMTEPAVASSDATNMKATCEVDGDEIVINGQKWWTSGAGDPRCAFLIFMGVTDPNAERHQRHSMVIVPIDTPGREDRAHAAGVRPPRRAARPRRDRLRRRPRADAATSSPGPGRGFEIAQGRLGPGRIHHCMRAIGAAERALAAPVPSAPSAASPSASRSPTSAATATSSPTAAWRSTRPACSR